MESDHCIWNSTIYRHLSAPSCWRLLKRRKCKWLKYYGFFLRNKLRLFKLLAAMEKENFDLRLLFPTLLSATFSSWNLAKKSLGSSAVFSFCAFARRSIILDFKNWQTYNASSAIFCYVKCVRFFHSFSRRLRRLNFAPLKVCLWRHLASLALSTLTSSDVRTSWGLSFEACDKRVVIAQIWRVAARLTLIRDHRPCITIFYIFSYSFIIGKQLVGEISKLAKGRVLLSM